MAVAVALVARAADVHSCQAALDRGDYTSAAQQAQALIKAQPRAAEPRVLLARAYMGQNKGAAALGQLREALRRDPKSTDALYYVSKLSGVMSTQEFMRLAQLDPDSPRMHQVRADALEYQGDAAGAEREYLAALQERPGTPYVMNALGDLKRHQRKFDEAIAWYAKVLEKDPDDYDAVYGTGVCVRSRSPEEAAPLFRKALQLDPASMAAKVALGESLVLTGKPAEAIPLLEDAAKGDPDLRLVQALLARAYQQTGRTEEARRAFERVRQLTKPGGEGGELTPEER